MRLPRKITLSYLSTYPHTIHFRNIQSKIKVAWQCSIPNIQDLPEQFRNWPVSRQIMFCQGIFLSKIFSKIWPNKVVRWCRDGDFLRSVFAASHVQRISDLHSKFALRPHHVPKYGKHPISDR